MKPAILALSTLVVAVVLALTMASTTPAHAELDFAVGDPVGDTIGTEGSVQHDIIVVSGLTDGSNFHLQITFQGPIEPPDSGGPNAVNGFILFDTDQDPSTGINVDQDIFQFCPFPLGIGQDVGLTLFGYNDEGAALYGSTGFGDPQEDLGRIPLDIVDQSMNFTIPLQLLGGDDLFNFSVVVGSFVGPPKGKVPESDPTDCAPDDGGFIDTAGLQATPEPTVTSATTATSEPAAATPTATAAAVALPPTGDGAGTSSRQAWGWLAAAVAAAALLAGGYAMLARRR